VQNALHQARCTRDLASPWPAHTHSWHPLAAPREHPTAFPTSDTPLRPRRPPARLRHPRHYPFSIPQPTILALLPLVSPSASPALPSASAGRSPGRPPPRRSSLPPRVRPLPPRAPPVRRPLPLPRPPPGPGLPGRAFTAGGRAPSRAVTDCRRRQL
jgi:hypothetical protein